MKKLLAAAALALPLIVGVSLAADFDGDSRDDIAIFRPSTGLWAVRGVTRAYFGGPSDTPAVGDYDGDGVAEIGIFRGSSGLWAIRGVTRAYFGGSSDTPITGGGGGQRTYDYVVKAGDGADLVRALESNTYRSVFIPAGTYPVSEVIQVDHVRQITGEDMIGTSISFTTGSNAYLSIEENYCHLEHLYLFRGGNPSTQRGNLYIDTNYVTVRECRSFVSEDSGFSYSSNAAYVSFIDCIANQAAGSGFTGPVTLNKSSRLTNCAARRCGDYGFLRCTNLSCCYVDGYGETCCGFLSCNRVSSAYVFNCSISGFSNSDFLSSCVVDGNSNSVYGFHDCDYLSSCQATNCTTGNYVGCTKVDPDSCNFL